MGETDFARGMSMSTIMILPKTVIMKHLKSNDFDFFVLGNKATSSLEYEFIGSPGVKLLPEGIASYLQCVKLFLSDEVISNIVKYTKTKLT